MAGRRDARRAATPKQAHQRADNDEEWRSAGLRRQAVARRAGL
jgi:hypothetical protein